MGLVLRSLRSGDIAEVVSAFTAIGWKNKDTAQFDRYRLEEDKETRVTRFAFLDGRFAGYLNVLWHSAYPPFAAAPIPVPEINDFNVLPHQRRKGIGTALMDEAEQVIAGRSAVAGLGVGMTSDYADAMRLYLRRGYLPDGRGLMTHERPVAYGESVTVDDGLALYLTRKLR